jgi:Flp pilus assembly protein TadD
MNHVPLEKTGYRRLCLLIVTVFAGVMALQKLYDYDIWWHLRSGQWIIEHAAFPKTDPFSFATAGADWTFAYWLSDPLYYLLWKLIGIPGLQFFNVLVIALAVLALFVFLTGRRLPSLVAALLAIWVVSLARFRFILRPLVFKFVGVVFLFWFFFAKPAFRFRYTVFFLVVLVWNGLYPAAFLAQVFAGFLLVEKTFERALKSSRYLPGEIRDAVILLGLASVALLINPYGTDLYRLAYGGLFSDYAAGITLVEEQQTLVWSAHPGFAALVGLAAGTFVVGHRNFRFLTLLVFGAFVVLAWGSVRFLGLSSFAMAAVIGVNLANYPWPAWLSARAARWRWSEVLGLGVLIVGCAVLWQMTFQKTRGYEFGLGIKQNRYPYAAVQLLKDAGFTGNLYNSWKFGGFLQWQLPAAKTFIDGRCLPAQLVLYDRFKTIDLHEFSRYLTENRVQAALLDRQDLRDLDFFANMPGFRQVYADDISVLFARSDLPLGQANAASGNYRFLRLGGFDYEYLAPLATSPDAPLVEAELLRAIKGAPDSFIENFQLAYFYEVRNDPRAAAQYLQAARKNPAFAVTHFNIGVRGGQAALKAGQWPLAMEIVSLALEYQKTGELYFLLGTAQHQLQQREAAMKSYRASLALAENAQVRNNLGFLLLEMNQPEEARKTFARGLEERTGASREQSLYGLALSLRALQQTDEAVAMRTRLAAEFPKSAYLNRLP